MKARYSLLVILLLISASGCGSANSKSVTCGQWRDGSKDFKTRVSEDFAERNINSGSKDDARDASREAIEAVCETNDDGEPAGDDFKPHDDALMLIATLIGER